MFRKTKRYHNDDFTTSTRNMLSYVIATCVQKNKKIPQRWFYNKYKKYAKYLHRMNVRTVQNSKLSTHIHHTIIWWKNTGDKYLLTIIKILYINLMVTHASTTVTGDIFKPNRVDHTNSLGVLKNWGNHWVSIAFISLPISLPFISQVDIHSETTNSFDIK